MAQIQQRMLTHASFEPFDSQALRYRLFEDKKPCDQQLVWTLNFPAEQ